MLNQVTADAAYSATYVEDYLDCVENLPNDLQRLISRIREMDFDYLAHIQEAQCQTVFWKDLSTDDPAKMSLALYKVQQALIAAEDLNDEKMSLLQRILDQIKEQRLLLDQDQKNLESEQVPPANNITISTVEGPKKRVTSSPNTTISGLDSKQRVLNSQVATYRPCSNNKKTRLDRGGKKMRLPRQNNQTTREEISPTVVLEKPACTMIMSNQ